MSTLKKLKKIVLNSNHIERFKARNNLGIKLTKKVKPTFKIGMAVLAYERPEYLEICLDSLFASEIYDFDITFLLQDDGSTNPKVKELLEKERDAKYKIVRYFSPKGPNNAGAAINKAVKKLMEMDDFDIIGWADGDALFHPEWLRHTMDICLWAKENHKDHILGPFTSFNSSDFVYHQVLGTYTSPFGKYVVKRQAGMLNYFYFKEDFLKLGFFEENKDDETLMTRTFDNLKVRNFCTETSWVEHLGQVSILNQWRPVPVMNAVHAIKPAKGSWGKFNIQDYRQKPLSYYAEIEREYTVNSFNISNLNRLRVLERGKNLGKQLVLKAYKHLSSIGQYNQLIKWWNNNLSMLSKEYGYKVSIGLNDDSVNSELPIEIVIPAIERDQEVLELLIDSIRLHIKHPIKKIHVVSPESDSLRSMCKDKDCEFVLENSFLDIKLEDIDYKVNGLNRAGWLFQQLIKLGADKFVDTENYLVLDADTVFVRDQVFESEGRLLLELSDESHTPYYHTYSKLTGEAAESPFSFVCHHMLINKTILKSLKEKIEKTTNMPWYRAICTLADREHPAASGFSEYETYGNYAYSNYADKIKLEYWYNLSLKRSEIINFNHLKSLYKKRYKTISFQYYK